MENITKNVTGLEVSSAKSLPSSDGDKSGYDLPVYGLENGQFYSIHIPAITCIILSFISVVAILVASFRLQSIKTFFSWTKSERFVVYLALCDGLTVWTILTSYSQGTTCTPRNCASSMDSCWRNSLQHKTWWSTLLRWMYSFWSTSRRTWTLAPTIIVCFSIRSDCPALEGLWPLTSEPSVLMELCKYSSEQWQFLKQAMFIIQLCIIHKFMF